MEKNFWLERWQDNDIGFHESEANAQLVMHFDALFLSAGSRVFVPLCGKTRDIAWLLSRGCHVVGVELSVLAIEQLFVELGIEPIVADIHGLQHFSAEGIDVFVGDLFTLSAALLGPVNAIYDRAALVALPEAMRRRYTAKLVELTHNAPQLLVCYEYDQSCMSGPPFSVTEVEVKQHYAEYYRVKLLSSAELDGGLKGLCVATEHVFYLKI